MRAALIDESTSLITNVIEISDENPESYSPPQGFIVEQDAEGKAQVGGKFTNGAWEAPVVPDTPVIYPEPTVQEQLDSLTALLKEKSVLTDVDISDIRKRKNPETPGPPN